MEEAGLHVSSGDKAGKKKERCICLFLQSSHVTADVRQETAWRRTMNSIQQGSEQPTTLLDLDGQFIPCPTV
jgi:hypothetical protein